SGSSGRGSAWRESGRRQAVEIGARQDDLLARERQRRRRILRVDLAREAVTVEDAVGDQPRLDAVADSIEARDPLALEPLGILAQLVVDRVVRVALRDQDDTV